MKNCCCASSCMSILGEVKRDNFTCTFAGRNESQKNNSTLQKYFFYHDNGITNICSPLFGKLCQFCGSGISYHAKAARTISQGRYPLRRTLLIFHWNISKHNILDFGGGIQSICSDSLLCGQVLGNKNFFGQFSKSS